MKWCVFPIVALLALAGIGGVRIFFQAKPSWSKSDARSEMAPRVNVFARELNGVITSDNCWDNAMKDPLIFRRIELAGRAGGFKAGKLEREGFIQVKSEDTEELLKYLETLFVNQPSSSGELESYLEEFRNLSHSELSIFKCRIPSGIGFVLMWKKGSSGWIISMIEVHG